ncbi:SARP family transcriptional regulator [Amycolatopsis mediterranei S699]|uniref:SARP family transcriptional regulator n=2 Tax=Amycolatopsis mediterranei TaxID=33910 RepID=A0A0H3DD04_AMYMU|nr:AfsR/SARP family transcriptional regulator [Amycolatopsis mediterranei]ADJ48596.1 SARP family transcriptional regulator [Amycolatopsis mediterranei U32]AEK45528.1 SARP family transcriptional regulator [Amycolatopsis mediterranei S699]AFO80305.1 SARP family transcriptional regulator [Amycolatopsis mediterranei S699]AGT87433.1 SARP family transcriptional regulator [Amycolatopsis mediterranei RB]KDO11205.1 SARP family transcriptional regulator [Amycolatopsis mediterranei]
MYSDERRGEGSRGSGEDDVRFTVLGPLEVLRDGVDHAPKTPKVLQLLAVLVTRPGRMVHIDTLIQELWSDNPPRTVRTTLHTYVYHLRRCIADHQLAEDADKMLTTRQSGYALHIEPTQVDVHDFGLFQHLGNSRRAAGDHAGAADSYRSALDLWSGAPLANLQCGPVLSAYRTELVEQQRNVLHLRIEAEIAGGHHRELIGELRGLATHSPLDEALHGQLMRALGRSGRRSDAMTVYRGLRSRLAGELGVEPCDELQLLHRDLISEGDHR